MATMATRNLSECERQLRDMVVHSHSTAAGLVILIGNEHLPRAGSRNKYGQISGPKKDIEHAKNVFSGCFGAACFVVENKPAADVKSIIKTAASLNYPLSYKFIVIMFSGHGKEFNLIANDEKPIDIENEVVKPFQPTDSHSEHTAEIPKLFFFDTCRGSETTNPIAVPRGGNRLETVYFPEKSNILVAYSTLPKKLCYEMPGQGGVWINKVLTRLKSDEHSSVTDVLQNVNLDMHRQYDPTLSIQQPELKSTLLGAFKFERVQQNTNPPTLPTPQAQPPSRQVSRDCPDIFTKKLIEWKASGKIVKKDYVNLAGPGNHVDLTITFPNKETRSFSSRNDTGHGYDSINNAREEVAEKAVKFIDRCEDMRLFDSSSPAHGRTEISRSVPMPLASPRSSVNPSKAVQELKNVLVDKKGEELNDDNYTFEESGENAGKKFRCTLSHDWFGHKIVGDWRKSKKEAKQSVALKALDFCQ